eukprot:5898054-Prymnesium_polylepis.1
MSNGERRGATASGRACGRVAWPQPSGAAAASQAAARARACGEPDTRRPAAARRCGAGAVPGAARTCKVDQDACLLGLCKDGILLEEGAGEDVRVDVRRDTERAAQRRLEQRVRERVARGAVQDERARRLAVVVVAAHEDAQAAAALGQQREPGARGRLDHAAHTLQRLRARQVVEPDLLEGGLVGP